ncbi:TonB-dependent receptor [Pedobacter namyangjuensis]|uniref:TonB-dependent receptor n=1 Tax=Pedobacter namyangjuensis TaxID=600626 RepID=UPI000DE25CB1|nr:TonB-dependent receptor [Pedobacter namyangjuensis]
MRYLFTLLATLTSIYANAQVDTVKKLNEVVVKGYNNPQQLLRSANSVGVLDSSLIARQPSASMVSLINNIAGVRMEERSPGSYRLSLRGSLLRSPFGIRNVKIYIDEFPLTDAGGNTYSNLLDVAAIGDIEIYKGPQASSFGANTGGAILINTGLNATNFAEINLNAGSYGLFHQTAKVQQAYKNYKFSVTQGYQRSDGYRENSALERMYFQTKHQWDYNERGSLNAFVFYSDLGYQTPGGLTAQQFAENPKSARPATATLPGAVSQQAGIYNKTIFAGISHQYKLNEQLKHVVSVFGSYTDFKNPFITNYEKRLENTLGLRSFFDYTIGNEDFKSKLQAGVETASTATDFKNFGNNGGSPTALRVDDDLRANQTFAFLQVNFDISNRWLVEISTSLNFYNYRYQSHFPIAIAEQKRAFKTKLMPKLATSYLITKNFSARASVAKGYSPPTLAEVRPSDNIINTELNAEAGWNYEGGLRFESTDKRFYVDANLFYFGLEETIVRRLNVNDNEYFINAGGTKQFGAELQTALWLLKNNDATGILSGIQLRNSYTYSNFKFSNFNGTEGDFANNKLSGVPAHVLTSGINLDFKMNIYFYAQHYFTAALPLNDANTAFAERYHLLELKAGITQIKLGKTQLGFNVGINNLLNESYSLGNDLNAVGNRYFNPAAKRNFYTGISVKL